MNINNKMNIKQIIEKYPETIEVFKNNGFKGLEKPEVLNTLSEISLEKAMNLKKINIEGFKTLLEEAIISENNFGDGQKNNKIDNDISITGLLPCPIRIPLLERFEKFLKENNDIKVDYELKAASSGLDWLKKEVIENNNIDELSDIFISAGFDLFFEKELMGKFKEQGIFKDITNINTYNKDFYNLKDPKGDYSMLGVVPAIFLVNKERLGDRIMPQTWKDILKPEFKKSVSLPIADFDLFNAILVNLYKKYGDSGVQALGESLMENMHPAQMISSNGPAITIMPYFFSKMIKENSPMVPIWPKDGAIISPIFMLTKKNKENKLKKIVEFMSGVEVGEILAHQGLFPSVNPNVNNPTENKPMMWIGWDYIYNNDMGKIIKHCESIFKKGVRE